MEYILKCTCGKRNMTKTQRFTKILKRRCVTCHKMTKQIVIGKVIRRYIKRNALVIRWL